MPLPALLLVTPPRDIAMAAAKAAAIMPITSHILFSPCHFSPLRLLLSMQAVEGIRHADFYAILLPCCHIMLFTYSSYAIDFHRLFPRYRHDMLPLIAAIDMPLCHDSLRSPYAMI